MSDFTNEELSEAHRALQSTPQKCEKVDSAKLGKSQQTLSLDYGSKVAKGLGYVDLYYNSLKEETGKM